MNRGAAENHLGNMFRADKFRHTIGDAPAFQTGHLGAETFRETEIGIEGVLVWLFYAELAVHVYHVKFGIHPARHAGSSSNQILSRRIRRDTHGNALPHRPVFPDVLRFHVGFQAAVNLFGDLPQSELAEGNEIAAAEEILERACHFFGTINVAPLHAILQGFRSEVHHYCFGGSEGDPVWNGLAHGNTGDRPHDGRNALDVLNVECGHNVDFCGQEFLHVFVTLAVLAPRDIRMGKFVNQNHLRAARENGIDVHLLEDRSFIFNLFPRDGLNTCEEFFDAFAAVGFHDTDHDVLATASAPERLAQHAKGFANARSVAEEKLENAACLLRGRGNFQPVFRLLWQRLIFSPAKTKAYAR